MSMTVLNVAYPLAPVGPDAVGGAEQVLSALDAALVDAGHRSLVVACEGSSVRGELIAVNAEAGKLDDAARRRAWARHRHAIAGALDRWPIDVVHLHGIDFPAYLPEEAPTLVTLHLPLSWYPREAWKSRPDLLYNCVSAIQQRDFTPPVDLVPPVPNGVPVSALSVRHARRNFALILGRICPEKGIHIGLEAARQAGVSAIIAGEVFRYETHERYFHEEVIPRLGPTARFVGPLGFNRKRRYLTAARCVLIPSLAAETASLVAMEAAACGTPAIAFPNGALPDTIEHGRTGFIVRDVEEMVEAIRRADQIDPQACRTAARQRFSLEAMAERYFAAYRKLSRETVPLRRTEPVS